MIANQAHSSTANDWRGAIPAGSEEHVAVLRLDASGMVRDCNRASEALFKYRRSELVWRPVSMLLPQLAAWELVQNGQPNPQLKFLCRISRRFQAVTRDGRQFATELFFNLLNSAGRGGLSLIVRPPAEEAADCGLQQVAKQWEMTS